MKNSTRKFKSETVSTAIDSDVASDASVSHEPRDMLSEILRDGAQKMLQAAIHLEVDDYLLERSSLVDKHGHRLVVRNGSLPERELLTGLGPIPVQQPRVRDKRGAEEREVFSSSILPKYLRKTRSIEELVPGYTSKASARMIFRRLCSRCSARMRRDFQPPRSRD